MMAHTHFLLSCCLTLKGAVSEFVRLLGSSDDSLEVLKQVKEAIRVTFLRMLGSKSHLASTALCTPNLSVKASLWA